MVEEKRALERKPTIFKIEEEITGPPNMVFLPSQHLAREIIKVIANCRQLTQA
jgi:hypothetical protein